MARYCMNLYKITIGEKCKMNKIFFQLYEILQSTFKEILKNEDNSIDCAIDLIV